MEVEITLCMWPFRAAAELKNKPRLAYFGVFDGHAGARAAEYAAEHLHVRFLEGLVAYMTMVEQGLVPGMAPSILRKLVLALQTYHGLHVCSHIRQGG